MDQGVSVFSSRVGEEPRWLKLAKRRKYEALKDKGMSKQRAAKIANSPGASKRGGEHSHSGSSYGDRSRGGTTAQKKAAGRKGGKATAAKKN